MAGTQTQTPHATITEPPAPAVPARPQKAYELTDEHGHRALVWWGPDGSAVVAADDPAFRRRVRKALRRPIWATEDTVGPDGAWSSYKLLVHPNDARYPSRLRWRWAQVGLDDVAVRVIPLQGHQLAHQAPNQGSLRQPQAERS